MSEGIDTETITLISTRENDRDKLFRELDEVEDVLGEGFNRSWKINPQDIADFYLLANVGYRPPEYQFSDEENVMLLRAEARMTEIGERISFAIIHEGFREHTKFNEGLREGNPELFQRIVPSYLEFKISSIEKAIAQAEATGASDVDFQDRLVGRVSIDDARSFLGYYRGILDRSRQDLATVDFPNVIKSDAASFRISEARELIKKYRNTPNYAIDKFRTDRQFWKDAMTIMELTYRYPQWTKMFGLAKAILFPEERNEKILPNVVRKEDAVSFLTDRLINAAHAAGEMIAFIANDLPEAALVLTLHGLKKGDGFLWEYASQGLRQELQNRSKPLLRKLGIQPSRISGWDDDVRQEFLRGLREKGGQLYKLGCLLGLKDEPLRKSLVDITKSWLMPGQRLSEYARERLSSLAGPSLAF